MKLRTDFVSNSSSSSFILQEGNLFHHFNITKDDVVNALIDAYGKTAYKTYIANQEKLRNEHPEYYEDETKNNWSIRPFYVYDMTIPEDVKEANERWGDLLDDWTANMCTIDTDGNIGSTEHIFDFNQAMDSICRIYDIINHNDKISKDDTMFVRYKNGPVNGHYGHDVKVPSFLVKLSEDLRKRCGIVTNLEVLRHEATRFFVHYEDNELWCGKMAIPGKHEKHSVIDKDDKYKLNTYSISRNKAIDNSIYESESTTTDRVFEVILNYLIKIGKVTINDEFLKTYFMIEEPSRYDIKHGNIYYTEDGKTYTYKDLLNDCLTFNGHEG